LKINQESGEPEPIFVATYEKWLPLSENGDKEVDNNQSIKGYEGYNVKDRLYLKKDKGDWVIYKIDRLSFKPVD